SSSLTLEVGEIAEQQQQVLWNYGGSSDEIFTRGWRYLVGIASPASDYLRALPPWTSREYSGLRRNCVLYSDKGTFGWQVARGVLESAQGVVQESNSSLCIRRLRTVMLFVQSSLRSVLKLLSSREAFRTS